MLDYKVFTDGAFSSVRNQGGSAIVITKDNKIELTYKRKYVGGTNNTAELNAIILALQCFKLPVDSITIYSDSQYCIGIITKGWNRKKNVDLWNKFDKVLTNAKSICNNISFEWVHGHQDNEYNNIADKLAVQASQEL